MQNFETGPHTGMTVIVIIIYVGYVRNLELFLSFIRFSNEENN